MNKKYRAFGFFLTITVLLLNSQNFAKTGPVEMASSGFEHSSAHLEVSKSLTNAKPGVSVVFTGSKDLHYYASPSTAPAPGMELKITAAAEGLTFGEPVWPEYQYFNDPAQGKIEVFVGDFSVFIPIASVSAGLTSTDLSVTIAGITCTSNLCFPPFKKTLAATLDRSGPIPQLIEKGALPEQAATDIIETAVEATASGTRVESGTDLSQILADWQTRDSEIAAKSKSAAWYLLLALLAGISINFMPCVLPVIPLIIMRLVSQAKESPARRAGLGFSFCGGIVLFFAMFAAISVAVKLITGTSLDLNSLYRNATAVTSLFLAIVFFALVLLDLLTLTLPSAVANKQGGSGSGFAASIGMGFFAGILSTPCSGPILGIVVVWLQTQHWAVSSTGLILMGIGMAMPYAIIVSIPSLLNVVPRPGTWMEHVKKAGGFLLLLIAVKFTLTALPKDHLINVLIYGVIFSFAVWMAGSWVTFSTPAPRKWTVRLVALAVAVVPAVFLLPAPKVSQIDWQPYDAAVIQKAVAARRPVVIKFTADWCTNCKIVDKNVFHQPDIAALLKDKRVLAVKADTTQSQYPAAQDMNAVFGEAGSVPLTILLNPKDQTLTKLRGIFTPEEFKQAIDTRF